MSRPTSDSEKFSSSDNQRNLVFGARADGTAVALPVDDDALTVSVFNQLVSEKYDAIYLGYTGDDLTTVTYKLAATTVATLTLAYINHILQSVVKT